MTAPQKPQDGLEVLLDALLAELMDMSSEQVLDGESPAATQARGLAMLSAAKQEAARRRLAGAKAGLAVARADARSSGNSPVSAAQAKAFLREAANAGKYTMAARQLDELSDQAALNLYAKFVRLGVVPPGAGGDSK
jgi:DNA invertase Pin-like site-specific DNA recombinase